VAGLALLHPTAGNKGTTCASFLLVFAPQRQSWGDLHLPRPVAFHFFPALLKLKIKGLSSDSDSDIEQKSGKQSTTQKI
jgi:hypothetical protein